MGSMHATYGAHTYFRVFLRTAGSIDHQVTGDIPSVCRFFFSVSRLDEPRSEIPGEQGPTASN